MARCFSAISTAAFAAVTLMVSGTVRGDTGTDGVKPSIVDPTVLAVTEQQSKAWAEELLAHLSKQLDIISSVTDAASAAEAVVPLRSCVAHLAAMRDRVNEEALWIYIENTPDAKQPFIELLLRTSGEFLRLNAEKFYGNGELQEILKTQMLMPTSQET